MRRAQIGDVYSIKLPNGYKIYQWAYDIPRYGYYNRVFSGLFDEIPDNIAEIVSNEHSYIIEFNSKRAYKLGLAQFLGNYPVPEEYPFPKYKFSIGIASDGEVLHISVMHTDGTSFGGRQTFKAKTMLDLPEEYQCLTLLNSFVPICWILYLFDIDWSPKKLSLYDPDPSGRNREKKLQKYIDFIKPFTGDGTCRL